MFLQIIQMLIGNIFVTIAAIHIFRFLRTRISHLDIPLFVFIWIYITTSYTFVLGLAGLLAPNKIAVISFIGSIILAYPYRKECGRLPQRLGDLLNRTLLVKAVPFDVLLLFLCLIEFARMALHVWYIPPYVFDTIMYHLPNVAEWVQKERIYTITAATARTNWPMTFEVFETWFVVFLHHDVFIQLASVWCSMLAFTSVYAIARTLNFGNRLSLFAAILYIFTPVVSLRATSCDTDLPVAGVFLLCVALVLELLRHGTRKEFQLRDLLLIMIMAFSFGVGVKPIMAFIMPGLILLLFVAIIKQRLVREFLGLFIPGQIHSCPHLLITAFLIITSGLLGLYWYIRNWIFFDNPFHPVDFSIFGHLIFGTWNALELFGPGQQGHASLSMMWLNLQTFLTDKIFDHHSQMNTDIEYMSGWGWFCFSCGLPALAYSLFCVKKLRLLIAAFIMSLLCLLACVDPDPWYMRFTLWFPSIFALSFVALVSSITNRMLKVPIIALAIVCTMLNFVAMINVGMFTGQDFKKMMSTPVMKRSTANLIHHNPGAYREALVYIPRGETIAYRVSKNGPIYPLYDSDFSRSLVFVNIKDIKFTTIMKQYNLKYLFVGPGNTEQNELLQKLVQYGILKKITTFLYILK